MIYVLDTNVLSEVMKPRPAEGIAAWMRAQPLRSLSTASICCAETLAGIAVLPVGRRQSELKTITCASGYPGAVAQIAQVGQAQQI